MQPTFWQIGPRKTPIFLQARAARRTSAGAKVKAKAESDGAGALRLGVAGAMDPGRARSVHSSKADDATALVDRNS